jgi:phasin
MGAGALQLRGGARGGRADSRPGHVRYVPQAKVNSKRERLRDELVAARDIPVIKKSNARVGKRTDASGFSRHISAMRVRSGYPRHRWFQFRLRGWKPVSDADMKVEASTNPPNANVQANEKRGFDIPLFALPKMAIPEIFHGIAEQGAVRARENCEKMKAASGEIADILRETYSTNARGATDYGLKIIEISGANTTSAFDFLTNLMGTKSLSEIIQKSATQSRKNFEVVSAQNKELWDLAQKVATETAEPIKKSVTRVLQKASWIELLSTAGIGWNKRLPREEVRSSRWRTDMLLRQASETGRVKMGVVMIKCPQTGRAIPTGLKADREKFRCSAVFFARTYCTICQANHEWFAREAWVSEPR